MFKKKKKKDYNDVAKSSNLPHRLVQNLEFELASWGPKVLFIGG